MMSGMLIFPLILFALSLLFTYVMRIFALKKNILDKPNQRSLHQIPTPRGGGLAFVVLFYVALVFLTLHHFIETNIFLSLLSGIPIAVVGYCDDLFGVKARLRALVHVLSAIWGMVCLHGVPNLNFGSVRFHSPVLFFMLAVFITVWFTNLYNFMDGIDGLAAMEAVFVSAAAGGFLLLDGFQGTALLCFALTFSVLGFLVWNWPPAKIFMGDVGSGFLGYIFAMLMWISNSQHQLSFPTWWILLSVFIADASYTLIHRLIQKKKLGMAHREHAFQRLNQAGLTHKQVTTSVLGINVLLCLPLALFYYYLPMDVIPIFLMGIVVFCWMTWFFIVRKYRYT
ncbi:MAG: glycosyltransferase family 4 protein [Gammaproteobacteria bacterium]|nr:glycosyltransferase family 4 protein [Gammaproteobacteria bacterium]